MIGSKPVFRILPHERIPAMSPAPDAAVIALQFNKIGSQIVSLRQENVERGDREARYIQTAPGFDDRVTLFSADFWGNPYYSVEVGGGTVHLQLARFFQSGQRIAYRCNGIFGNPHAA